MDASCAFLQQLDTGPACADANQDEATHTLIAEAFVTAGGATQTVFVQWYCADVPESDNYQRRFIVVAYDSGLGPSAGVFWHSEQSGGGESCTTDVYVTGTPVGQDLGCPAGQPPTYAVPGVLP